MANVFPASSSNPAVGSSHITWADEFLDFSAPVQRFNQGRLFSDAIAFFDPAEGGQIHQEKANYSHSQGEEGCSKTEPSSAQQEDLPTESAVDPKKIKRVLANRQSAQRSRLRKLHYISELEQTVLSLQAEVAALSPRVAFFDHQRSLLTLGNGALKQRIAALAGDKIFMDAHQEALRNEIERLRRVFLQQNLKRVERSSASSHHQIEEILN